MIEKQPKMMNMASHPSHGTTVLLNKTPITADMPNPVKKRAFTRTPNLYQHKLYDVIITISNLNILTQCRILGQLEAGRSTVSHLHKTMSSTPKSCRGRNYWTLSSWREQGLFGELVGSCIQSWTQSSLVKEPSQIARSPQLENRSLPHSSSIRHRHI